MSAVCRNRRYAERRLKMKITDTITKDEYIKLAKKKAPKSKLLADVIKAFLVGGAICTLGEAISTLYTDVLLLPEDAAAAWTSMSMIFLGSLLTALGVYDKIGRFAGAGSIVPITGFANSIVSPAMEFKSEGLVLGMAAKMFSVAGPVLVYGIGASVIAGMIYCLIW